jgi:hypothetical protein
MTSDIFASTNELIEKLNKIYNFEPKSLDKEMERQRELELIKRELQGRIAVLRTWKESLNDITLHTKYSHIKFEGICKELIDTKIKISSLITRIEEALR